VALGIGTAVTLGVGCGIGCADTSASSAGSPSHADPNPGLGKKGTSPPKESQSTNDASSTPGSPGSRLIAVVHDAFSAFDGAGTKDKPVATKAATPAAPHNADDFTSTADRTVKSGPRQPYSLTRMPLRLAPSRPADAAPVGTKASAPDPVHVAPLTAGSLGEVSLATMGRVAVSLIAPKPSLAATQTAAPRPGVVATLIDDVLHPIATGTVPDIPQGVAPAMWTIAAAARRELEGAAASLLSATTQVQPAAQATLTQRIFGLIETAMGDIFNTFERVTQGPPRVPPGSTVTVQRSTLQLPCDNRNCTVPADWYFPDDPNPTGIVYFQNGALATGAMYSYTAADLAEQTDSIVVVPTVTDFYQADGYWLGGTAMEQATADLFTGSRDALTASASAAAGHPVTLPQKVVLIGHSEGGQFVTGAAADMIANGSGADLAGVLLYDGATTDLTQFTTDLKTIPTSVPVLLIASPPSYWNQLGATADALVAARPGIFTGVELQGGTHGDSVQGANPLTQFAENVVAGFPKPQNTAALGQLSAVWVTDMLEGTAIPGTPGQSIAIATDKGTATAYTLPAPPTKPSPIVVLIVDLTNIFTQLVTGT
jgi:hypothetical protein